MGYVRAAGYCGGYGIAAVVGVGGYGSDWDCELVVCVSDGLVWLGMARRDEAGELFAIGCDSCLGYSGRSMLRPYQCNPRVRVVISRQRYEHNIESVRTRPKTKERCRAEARRYESNIEGSDESSAEATEGQLHVRRAHYERGRK